MSLMVRESVLPALRNMEKNNPQFVELFVKTQLKSGLKNYVSLAPQQLKSEAKTSHCSKNVVFRTKVSVFSKLLSLPNQEKTRQSVTSIQKPAKPKLPQYFTRQNSVSNSVSLSSDSNKRSAVRASSANRGANDRPPAKLPFHQN